MSAAAARSLYAYGASRRRAHPEPAAPTTPTGWFHANVQAELKARGWSARELARRAGITHNALSQIGKGNSPSLERAGAIAEALGMPLGDLIAPRPEPAE